MAEVVLSKGTPFRFHFDVVSTRSKLERELEASSTALEQKGMLVGYGASGGGAIFASNAAVAANGRLTKPMTESDAKRIVSDSIHARFPLNPGAIVWDTIQGAREAVAETAKGSYQDVKSAAAQVGDTVKKGAFGFGLGFGLLGGVIALGAGIAAFIYFFVMRPK